MRKEIAVIGGGASGMAAAIAAAREGGRVTVYERNPRPGKKLLATGNGKCNLGNESLSPEDYHGGSREFVASCLARFGTEETKAFFRSLGLVIKERNGYLYPASEQASVVLDVLRFGMEECGVRLIADTKVKRVARAADGRLEVCWDGGKALYDRVILSCGGQASPLTGSDGSGYLLAKQLGLRQTAVVPALTALRCGEEFCKAIAGVRADAEVSVFEGGTCLMKERGELQLVDYGISGIPVFQLSGRVNYLLKEGKSLTARIDFWPDWPVKDYEVFLEERLRWEGAKGASACSVETFFTGMLHKKLMLLFIKLAGLKGSMSVAEADRERLKKVFRLCREFTLHITGSNSFEQAQTSAGGVRLTEVTRDLEAKRVPGLYLTGELLDVDGRCGGYNLQWAWCSGYLAGRAAGHA